MNIDANFYTNSINALIVFVARICGEYMCMPKINFTKVKQLKACYSHFICCDDTIAYKD